MVEEAAVAAATKEEEAEATAEEGATNEAKEETW